MFKKEIQAQGQIIHVYCIVLSPLTKYDVLLESLPLGDSIGYMSHTCF